MNNSPLIIPKSGKNLNNPSIIPENAPKCPHCGSTSFKSGAGLKPGQESIHCQDCKKFIGYRNILPIKRLKRLKKPKRLTDCLNMIDNWGFKSEYTQLFILSLV
ncbi:MAG: hypothetical protein F6K41_06515 [Symploca sp. SIO3E6]|nr:hypothetical protein [Caldora sp. SIO3E6]